MPPFPVRTFRPLVVAALALGSVVAAGLPAQAYGPPPSAGSAACTPAAQTAPAGTSLRNLSCIFTYTDSLGHPSVGQPFSASATGAKTVGAPPLVTDKAGQALVTFAYLSKCDRSGDIHEAVVTGHAQTTAAQATAAGTCTDGVSTGKVQPVTPTPASNQAGATEASAPNCTFSQALSTGINGREDLCTFHTESSSLHGISYVLAHGLGNRSASIVHFDSAPDNDGNFTATVDYFGGDAYTVTAGLRNTDGTLGTTATMAGSGAGTADESRSSATARAANVRGLLRFAVLAGSALTDNSDTRYSGDVGVDTAAAMTTVDDTKISNGTRQEFNDLTHQANLDGKRAYDAIAALPADYVFAGDQIGQTMFPGVHYTGGAFANTGTLTLDGQGDPNSIFIIKVDAAMNTAAGSHLRMINGAKASNVTYWVNGAFGSGAKSDFAGSVLAFGAISIGAGTSFQGNLYTMVAMTLASGTMRAPFAP